MTGREIMKQTLEFRGPSRVPRQFWTLPWAEEHCPDMVKAIRNDFPQDIGNTNAFLREKTISRGDPCLPGEFIDEWGCVFENVAKGYIGEVKQPLVTQDDWSDAGNVHIPEELLSIDIEKINAQCAASSQFMLAGECARPFEQLQFIRGTAQLYIDLLLRPKGMMDFIEKMHDFYCRWIRAWAQTDVDAICFMDDWGSQTSLLINPREWKEIFQPMYQDYIDIAKAHGKKVTMHSDGNILEIYPYIVDMGVDMINSQVFCIGVENLKPFRGKITLWGEMDRQHILATGSMQDVRDGVKRVFDTMWKDGGCIAQCEFGPGAKPDNVYEVFRAWNEML